MKKSELLKEYKNILLEHMDEFTALNTAQAILAKGIVMGLTPKSKVECTGKGCLCTLKEACPECDPNGEYVFYGRWDKE